MTFCTRMCQVFLISLFYFPTYLHASTPIPAIVIFGDSLSDTGNTAHLLKSLQSEENPAYLVRPLKVFVIRKMTDFAYDYNVPPAVLDAGIEMVHHFFDKDLGPLLANIISKIRRLPIIPAEPYWQWRFTNGPVWNEYLAPMLSLNSTHLKEVDIQAFGGSWAATYDQQLTVWNLIRHPANSLKALIVGKLIPPSFGLTVQAYLLIQTQLESSTVYFIWTGANDYLNILRLEDNYNPAVMSLYIDNVLDGLNDGIKKLIAAGARHIVVLGLPEVGYAPKFNKTMDKEVLNAAVQTHNFRLQARIIEWQNNSPEVDFLYIATQPYLERAIHYPDSYGLDNVADSCIDIKLPMIQADTQSPFAGNYVLEYIQLLQGQSSSFTPDEKNYHVCDHPEKYLFWDEIHPTTKIHRYMAYDICQALKAHGYQADCQPPASLAEGIVD